MRITLGAKFGLLLVGVSALLAAGLTGLGYQQAATGLREQAEAALRADARTVSSLIDGWNDERLADLRLIAALPAVIRLADRTSPEHTPADLEAAQEVVVAEAATNREIDFAVLDDAGNFLASSNPKDLGQNVGRRDYFRAAIGGDAFISGVSVSTITDQPSIFHAVPIHGPSGSVIGVARSRATPGLIFRTIHAASGRVGAGAQGLLADEQGLIIASTISDTWTLKPVVPLVDELRQELEREKRWGTHEAPPALDDRVLASVLQHTDEQTFAWRLEGTAYHALTIPLQKTRWTYVAALPVATFERSARHFLYAGLVWAGVGLGLAIVVALLFSRRVAGPIRRLTEVTARIISDDDLTQPLRVTAGRDEVGQLAITFDKLVARLRDVITTLRKAAQVLTRASSDLGAMVQQQTELVSRHASALQGTQVTAQEIKHASMIAAQRAEAVLRVAERADMLGKSGEAAVDRSVHGLTGIRAEVAEISDRISQLAERTRQIGGITESVKDLADRSNILALNAALEAVRSGEHGKGFAVVAREIRSLANQSIEATSRVRDILQDVSRAIGSTVEITTAGSERMEGELVQVKHSGDTLRELSTIMKEALLAVRQIAAAVSEQNAGITVIFNAVTEQMDMMDETRRRLDDTTRAADELQQVSKQVFELVERYRV